MRYPTASSFRAALEDRLRRAAQEGSTSLGRLRKQAVFDRLLARLLVVAPDRWVVKGGVALDLRLGDAARTTKDLDLARRDDEAAATADLLAAQALDLGDHFVFTTEKVDRLAPLDEGASIRYRVNAELAGRRFDTVVVDVGFDDPLEALPDRVRGSDLFGFAGIAPIDVPALPLEQHLAEKLHAYTRTYSDGRRSSRAKDLVDILLIQASAEFEAGRLWSAFARTFDHRGTHAVPVSLPPPPTAWTTPYRQLAQQVDLPPQLSVGHARAAAFLDPVLSGTATDAARWDPVAEQWTDRGTARSEARSPDTG